MAAPSQPAAPAAEPMAVDEPAAASGEAQEPTVEQPKAEAAAPNGSDEATETADAGAVGVKAGGKKGQRSNAPQHGLTLKQASALRSHRVARYCVQRARMNQCYCARAA